MEINVSPLEVYMNPKRKLPSDNQLDHPARTLLIIPEFVIHYAPVKVQVIFRVSLAPFTIAVNEA